MCKHGCQTSNSLGLVEGVWTGCLESRLVLGSNDTVWEWELDLRVVELLDVDSSCLGRWDDVDGDDVERSGSHSVTGCHVSVACGDGVGLCELTVFTVPVVGKKG